MTKAQPKRKVKKRKGGQGKSNRRRKHKPNDRWEENYERLRLVLGSLIRHQGGEIRIPVALCEQYDVTQVLNVDEDKDTGEYVLTLTSKGGESPEAEEKPSELPADSDTTGCNLDAYAYMVYVHVPDGDEYKIFGEFNDALDRAESYCEEQGFPESAENHVIPLFRGSHPTVGLE